MSARRDPKSWRELRDELRGLGASPVRLKGSHEVWRFPDGKIFVAVVNHLNDAVDANIVAKFRRLRERRCAAGEEPALLGRTGS